MMKKLVWRCDDFGSASGANEGILQVARLGLPINISVLTCALENDTALEELAQLGPQVCLGVHAAVNSEWAEVKWGPVTEAGRAGKLADANGHFHPDYEIISKLKPEVIAAEIEGQIQRAQEWKMPFSYLDEHMGFAWIEGVVPLLTDLAKKYGLVYRRDLPGLPEIKNATPDLVGRVIQQLEAVRDESPHLAVFHPSLDDASTRRFYVKGGTPGEAARERQQEVDALTSEAWRKLVSGGDVQLLTYRDL
jgi:predicted glycoside hydrolase/deacetylase ChbG (UPF0249 family)